MTRILLVEDFEIVARQISAAISSKCGVVTEYSTVPRDPAGFDYAVLDWQPHGPRMVSLCNDAGVPYVVWTGAPWDVPDGIQVVNKLEFTVLFDVIRQFVKESSTGGDNPDYESNQPADNKRTCAKKRVLPGR